MYLIIILMTSIQASNKYFITVKYGNIEYNLRVFVVDMLTDYVVLKTLESSHDIIPKCGNDYITIAREYITKAETLHSILNDVMIDDMIYLVNEYI